MREGFSGSAAAAAKAAVVALVVGVALSACGQQTGYGTLIGVRPVATPPVADSSIDTTSLLDSLNNELNLVNQTTPITDENTQFAKEFSTLLTLKQTERLSALQQLGAQIISTRLSAIAQVRKQVAALPLADGQKYQIVYLLDSAAGGLRSMQVKIAGDTLVDVARADVKKVAAFRVYGLLLPQCHMLIAAYDFQRLVGVYSTQMSTLQTQIDRAAAGGTPVPAAQAAVNDLGAQIVLINKYSTLAISVLPRLAPSGYPGNRGTVTAIRNELNAASTASTSASADVQAAKTALSI